MIAASEIKLIGLDVIGVTLGQTLVFIAAQPESQSLCDLLGDRVLDGENIREFFIKGAGPERRTVPNFDQARGHPDSIARPLDIPFQDRTDL